MVRPLSVLGAWLAPLRLGLSAWVGLARGLLSALGRGLRPVGLWHGLVVMLAGTFHNRASHIEQER